jgi:acetylornithine deacetylase/succinyl-diaminopimelate desuccinylase-like protein
VVYVTIALDHLVLGVRDLERTIREFRAAGFDVLDGGRQDSGPTVSALISCRDQTYIELVSFGSPTMGRAARLLARTPGWQPIMNRRTAVERRIGDGLGHAEGLIGLVLRVDDLDARVADLRDRGFAVDEPTEVRHTTPSGDQVRWRMAATDDPTLPMLIADATATELRVPASDAIGIDRVTVVTDDLDRSANGLRALLGEPDSAGMWRMGATTIRLDSGKVDPALPRMRARLDSASLPPIGWALGLSSATDEASPAAVQRLSQALQLQTVSFENAADRDEGELAKLGTHLETSFPLVHSTLRCEKFGHSRLYTWPGTDRERVAALFLAHMDVVPVGDPDAWTHPAFAGVVDDEFIWGRGAIDDKSRVLALLEAVESELANGFAPQATLLFAFGHDEEIGGDDGAAKIAAHLAASGIRPELVLDEGGVVTRGVVDGVERPVASIMLGEKGFATVRLSVHDKGGHSSMPPKRTAVGIVARAVDRLQENPMPLRVTPVVLDMVQRLTPFFSEPRRSLLGVADRLGPLLARIMSDRPQTEALVRTTTAPTVIRGGVSANVLPQLAEALVNFRILQGDSVAGVLAHCEKVVADERVSFALEPGLLAEPSPLTRSDSPAFTLVADTARSVVPGIAITTGLVPGATDARHYDDIAQARLNFAPIVLDVADLERIHGNDERISLQNYGRLIAFNRRLVAQL